MLWRWDLLEPIIFTYFTLQLSASDFLAPSDHTCCIPGPNPFRHWIMGLDSPSSLRLYGLLLFTIPMQWLNHCASSLCTRKRSTPIGNAASTACASSHYIHIVSSMLSLTRSSQLIGPLATVYDRWMRKSGKGYQIELGSAHGNSSGHPDSCGWLSSNSAVIPRVLCLLDINDSIVLDLHCLIYLTCSIIVDRAQLGLSGTLPIFAGEKEPMKIENSTALVYKQQRQSRKHSDRSLFASRTRTLHMDSLSWCWIAYNVSQNRCANNFNAALVWSCQTYKQCSQLTIFDLQAIVATNLAIS